MPGTRPVIGMSKSDLCGCRLCARGGGVGNHARRTRRLAQLRIGGVHHILRADIAVADRDVEIVRRGELQRLQRRLQRLLRAVHAGLAERLRQLRASGVEMLLALLLMDEAADARARLAGDDDSAPIAATACRRARS